MFNGEVEILLILSLATPQLAGNRTWRERRGAGAIYKMSDVPALTILDNSVDISMENSEDSDLCLC